MLFKLLCEPLCLRWAAGGHRGYRRAQAEAGGVLGGQQCPVLDWAAGTPFPRCALGEAARSLVPVLCPERHLGGVHLWVFAAVFLRTGWIPGTFPAGFCEE